MGYPKRLARAKPLASAWDKYVAYLAKVDDRPNKVGQGTKKPATTDVYIEPFGLTIAATQRIKARANTVARSASIHAGIIATYSPTAAGTNNTILEGFKSYKPARISYKSGISVNGTPDKSDRTGLPYLNYGGTSGSFAVGKGGGKTTQKEVLDAFRALIGVGDRSQRYTLIEEKV